MLHYFQSLFISIRFCEINLQIASIRCKPWQKYYPKHAVAVAECHEYGCYKYIVAKSTPQYGYHAEEIEIRYLARTRQLYVEAIYITYSPDGGYIQCISVQTLIFRLVMNCIRQKTPKSAL